VVANFYVKHCTLDKTINYDFIVRIIQLSSCYDKYAITVFTTKFVLSSILNFIDQTTQGIVTARVG